MSYLVGVRCSGEFVDSVEHSSHDLKSGFTKVPLSHRPLQKVISGEALSRRVGSSKRPLKKKGSWKTHSNAWNLSSGPAMEILLGPWPLPLGRHGPLQTLFQPTLDGLSGKCVLGTGEGAPSLVFKTCSAGVFPKHDERRCSA